VGDGNGRRKEYSVSLYITIDGADKRDIQKEDMEEYYGYITTLFHLPFFFSVFFPKFFFCFCFLIENKKKEENGNERYGL